MSAIYYDQESEIKVNQRKTIVTFDKTLESKILDAGIMLLLLNLHKTMDHCLQRCFWSICDRIFNLLYS